MRARQFALSLLAVAIFCSYAGRTQSAARPNIASRVSSSTRSHQITEPTTVDGCLTTFGRQKDARAWCLFRVLLTTGTNGDPAWVDWYAKPSTGLGSFDCSQAAALTRLQQREPLSPSAKRSREIHEISLPTQLRTIYGQPSFSSHDRVLEVGSQNHYNRAATSALCGLTGNKALSQAMSGANGPVSLESQQPEIIVKTAYAVAYKDAGTAYQINIWANQKLAGYGPTDTPTQNPYLGWTTTVKPIPGGTCPATPVSYTAATFQYTVPTISMNCFYNIPVESGPDLRYLESQSLMPVISPGGSAYLLLLGINVMARLPKGEWTWQTYWWSGSQTELDTAASTSANPNPLIHNQHYSQFVMTSGQGNVYNPYLEAVLPGGKNTDCKRCHTNAMYTPAPNQQKALDSLIDCQLTQRVCPSSQSNPHNVTTDSIWSVADVNVLSGTSAGAGPQVGPGR